MSAWMAAVLISFALAGGIFLRARVRSVEQKRVQDQLAAEKRELVRRLIKLQRKKNRRYEREEDNS